MRYKVSLYQFILEKNHRRKVAIFLDGKNFTFFEKFIDKHKMYSAQVVKCDTTALLLAAKNDHVGVSII